MFGILKKKLKDAIGKVTGKIEKTSEKSPEEAKAEERIIEEIEEKKEEIEKIEEKIVEEIEEKKEELEKIAKEDLRKIEPEEIEEELKESVKEDEKLLEEAEEEKKELEEIKEKIAEERVAEAPKEEKGRKFSILKKIQEKTISEDDTKEILHGIKHALLENDVALEVAERICADVKTSLVGKTVKRGKTKDVIESALRDAMIDVLNQEKIDLEKMLKERKEPFLIIFLGFNGSGKTTTTARVAYKFRNHKPVLAAGDTFRAASIEQLEEHGKNLKMDVVKHRYGADSAAVIFDARKHAAAKGSRLVLADTAGRSHTNVNLMDELKKVCRVNKPDMKVLVLDALTGNDIYEQARLFDNAVGVDALILTKTDVYEKGGAALSAAYTIKKPIIFLGTGQDYKDLQEFDAGKIVKSLLG